MEAASWSRLSTVATGRAPEERESGLIHSSWSMYEGLRTLVQPKMKYWKIAQK